MNTVSADVAKLALWSSITNLERKTGFVCLLTLMLSNHSTVVCRTQGSSSWMFFLTNTNKNLTVKQNIS